MKTKLFIILTALLMLFGNAQASYYWYAGADMLTSATVPGAEGYWPMVTTDPQQTGWHIIEGEPTSIATGELAYKEKINWVLAVPTKFGLNAISNGEDVTDAYDISTVTCADGVQYMVFRQIAPSKKTNRIFVKGNDITFYTLTYMVDGEVYKTYQLAEGTAITPEPEPQKDGYVFSGWDYVPKTMPAYDVTVTGSFAKKEAKTYTLTYMVDGAVYKTYQLAEGDAITPEPEPKKEGYTFSGWDYVPKTMPAYDVTVKGSFTKNSVPVDDSVIAEIDWTVQTAYYEDVWYSDPAEVSVKKGKGLIINCTQTNPNEAQYWEPQVPIIVNIPQIKKGGRYVVKFDVNAPAAGEIRLDFCSWDGTDASQGWIGTVTAGDNIITASFLNYPKNCTDAFIFYQCGKIPGNHIIKKVQVLQLSDSNYSLTYKVDGIVYKTYILKEDTTITPEPDPKKDGYVFSGWDNVPKTMPAKDVTVNGSFTKSGSAINSVSMDQTDTLIFDIQGNRLNHPRKGVNIIKNKDGKTKKVVIR